jgi:hypothetical protein
MPAPCWLNPLSTKQAAAQHRIEIAGALAVILALGDAQTTRPAASAGLMSETLVAGGRIDLDRTAEEFGIGSGKSKLQL